MREILAARPEHNRMMARHLPGLWDEFFLRLQAAAAGQYQPSEPKDASPDDRRAGFRQRMQTMRQHLNTLTRRPRR